MKNLIPKRVMEYIIITFAVVLMDVGIYVFKFPNNFSFGGVSGMAVVFSHFIPMTSAQINLVINLILLVIGFIVLGRDFGVKTAYVTVVSSLLLNVFEKQVPIYMQFKLVLNDTFDKYNCGEFDKKENDTISVSKSNFSHETDEVNVMISDTYPLSLSQLPEIKKNIPTLLISRNNTNDVNRYDSPELVRYVVNEVRSLNNNIKKVNVYATTNPLNTKNIASSAFKLGGRDNFNEVRVFQQERDGIRKFNNKGIVVYKR